MRNTKRRRGLTDGVRKQMRARIQAQLAVANAFGEVRPPSCPPLMVELEPTFEDGMCIIYMMYLRCLCQQLAQAMLKGHTKQSRRRLTGELVTFASLTINQDIGAAFRQHS